MAFRTWIGLFATLLPGGNIRLCAAEIDYPAFYLSEVQFGSEFALGWERKAASILDLERSEDLGGDWTTVLRDSSEEWYSEPMSGRAFFRLANPRKWNSSNLPHTAWYSSLALSSMGQVSISYSDADEAAINYASFNGSSWEISKVYDENWSTHTSLAFGPEGRPAIAFFDEALDTLKFTSFNGSAWVAVSVDPSPNVGQAPSLAFAPTGFPAISYYDAVAKDLKFASFDGSNWKIEVVDSAGEVGSVSELKFSSEGKPSICYYSHSAKVLKFASFNGESWGVQTVDSSWSTGQFLSYSYGPNGLPVVAYSALGETEVRLAEFDGTIWHKSLVADLELGRPCLAATLAFDPSGEACVGYSVAGKGPHFARRYNGNWVVHVIDGQVPHSSDLKLTFEAGGKPVVTYRDPVASNLRLSILRPLGDE